MNDLNTISLSRNDATKVEFEDGLTNLFNYYFKFLFDYSYTVSASDCI
jgi:hypothetical protein